MDVAVSLLLLGYSLTPKKILGTTPVFSRRLFAAGTVVILRRRSPGDNRLTVPGDLPRSLASFDALFSRSRRVTLTAGSVTALSIETDTQTFRQAEGVRG